MTKERISTRRNVVFAGLASVAIAASLCATAPQANALFGFDMGSTQQTLATIAESEEASSYLAEADPYTELMAVYTNPLLGYALLVDADTFSVTETNEGAGVTWFSQGEPGGIDSFYVGYNPVWDGQTPSLNEYFEEQSFAAQMEHPDCVVLTEGTYQIFEMAGVPVATLIYVYPEGGDVIEHVDFAEVRNDGIVYYGASYSQTSDDTSTVLGLKAAIATFTTSSDTYGDNPILWCTPETLDVRPAALQNVGPMGQPNSTGVTVAPASTTQTASSTQTESLNLVQYDGGFFTMMVPEGWRVMVSGYGASASIEAYDPADPATRLMYWGEIPFNISPFFIDMCDQYAQAGGELGSAYAFYGALPLLQNYSMAGAVDLFDDLCWNMLNIGGTYDESSFFASSVQVTSSMPVSYLSSLVGPDFIYDEAIVGANITLMDGTECYGDFLGSLAVTGDPGYVGMATAVSTWATIAPVDRYDAVSPVLAQCVGTLRFSQAYIEEAIREGEIITANALEYGRQMDAIMAASTQNFCDYILDRDRYILSDGSTLLVYY